MVYKGCLHRGQAVWYAEPIAVKQELQIVCLQGRWPKGVSSSQQIIHFSSEV
jgi:hypothetical protein